jgi:dihydrofolate reductase
MRKVVMFNLVSLDGFFEGSNHEIDWHNVDGEFNEYSIEQLHIYEPLLFGRATYEMMASYWPMPAALRDDPVVANLMNTHSKIVFSNTLQKASWNNTRLVKGEAGDEIKKLKDQTGKDMVIFGSGKLAASLSEQKLIDEYRILVNPVVLGSGHTLFAGLKERLHLNLTGSREFKSGNMLLIYEPMKGEKK